MLLAYRCHFVERPRVNEGELDNPPIEYFDEIILCISMTTRTRAQVRTCTWLDTI